MVINRKVVGAAAQTFITSGMSPTVPGVGQTFTVNDDTGYPASGAFVVVIDREATNEEKVLVSSRSGTTFTVGQRGYDGTTGNTHTSGEATCEHALDAASVQLLFDHVDDVEVDPHSTKLLNVARHDLEARHQFGSGLAFGVPVTPTALTPDIAGAAGTGNNPAREDHVHNVPAATATTITNANQEGSAATFARSDHNHAYGANSVTAGHIADNAIDDEAQFVAGLTPVIVQAGNPGAVGAGRLWYNTTADKRALLRRNTGDTAWEVLEAYDWIQYTPTYPGMAAVGNAQHTAFYARKGGMVVINGFFRIGSTTSFAGLTNLSIALPTNAQAKDLDTAVGYPGTNPQIELFGHAAARGTTGSGVFAAVGIIPQAGASKALDRMNFFATAGSAAWAQTVPAAWSSGDRFSYFAEYWPATLEDTNWV